MRPSLHLPLGYGIVCGLIFPLMISSTYLQALSLSHGAGDSFGLMFFAAYALTMLVHAVTFGIGTLRCTRSRRMTGSATPGINRATPAAPVRPSGPFASGQCRAPSPQSVAKRQNTLRDSPQRRATLLRLTCGLASAFLGNALMLARQLGLFDLGLPQTVAMALLIGVGLASAELAWLERLSCQHATAVHARIVACAFLVGAAIAVIIFVATGPVELCSALALLVVALLLATVRSDAQTAPLGTPGSPSPQPGEQGQSVATARFVKATLCLIVFAFVFGAVSQANAFAERSAALTELQAISGIVIAALLALLMTRRSSARQARTDLYSVLFPIVAVTLVALPFVTSPVVLTVAVTLVFVAFYLIGIHVRGEVASLSTGSPTQRTALASLALGLGAISVLAGVLMGAAALSTSNPSVGLAAVSLVSLFVLSMSPTITRLIEQHFGKATAHVTTQDATPADQSRPKDPAANAGARVQAFAEAHDLTQREAEVLALICQGRTRAYIAEELGISPNTVKGYIHAVYQKAGVSDKQDLIDRVEAWDTPAAR